MESLIELWQQAKIDESGMDRAYNKEEVPPQIMKLERRQQKLLMQKTLGSIIVLLALLIVFINRFSFSIYSLLGIGIFSASTIVILIILNRLRFRITIDERSLPTLQLADVAASKIRTERQIFSTYLPVFAFVALVGFNLMYLDFFREEAVGTRLLYHLVMSGVVAVLFVAGLFVRIKRFRKQFLPLLELISKFKMESENEDV
jgi:amino acid transporter